MKISLLLQVHWGIMNTATCTMSTKEVRYMPAGIRFATGTTLAKGEAERSGVTLRHMRRLFKRWREGSEEALVHRARGLARALERLQLEMMEVKVYE